MLELASISEALGPLWCIRDTDSLPDMLARASIRELVALFAYDKPKEIASRTAGGGGKAIAQIKIAGPMMRGRWMFGTSTDAVAQEVDQASADDGVGGILLRIDSPGGISSGVDVLAQRIKAAGKRKPVVAQIDGQGASAAYWAASQADRIYASSATDVGGSIGSWLALVDTSKAEEQAGIRVIRIATGPLKGIGLGPITDEQESHLRGMVNSIQGVFSAAVQKGRRLTDRQLEAVSHGGIMTAEQMIAAKLIDGIQSPEETVRGMVRSMNEVARPPRSEVFPLLRHELPTVA